MTNQEIDQIMYDTAISEGFTPATAKYVVAQARFESADYSSNVFKLNNNTSGMKFVGQPLATKGTLAPYNERSSSCRSSNICANSDYYAKFKSVEDSAKDKISRNYNLTMRGVAPSQLKNATSPEEFAHLLKLRGYYGGSETTYALGIRAKLLKISVIDFYKNNRTIVNYTAFGIGLLGIGVGLYFMKKKGIIFKK